MCSVGSALQMCVAHMFFLQMQKYRKLSCNNFRDEHIGLPACHPH
jgi:hypothetical protein